MFSCAPPAGVQASGLLAEAIQADDVVLPRRRMGFIIGRRGYGGQHGLRARHRLWFRATAGAELRIFVPVFGAPLRFIYSSNLEPLPDDRFESFQFSIGATF